MAELSVKPHPSSVNPALRIELVWEYQDRYVVPLRAEGQVKSERGQLVGHLVSSAVPENAFKTGILPQSQNPTQQKRKVLFDCLLSHRALEHILDCRDSNPRGDVVLNVDLILWTLNPVFRVGPQMAGSAEIPFFAGTTAWGSGFGTLNSEVATGSLTIYSSQWTTDYAPAFGIGRFFTVELPDPRPAKPPSETSFGGRLTRAVAALDKMERDVRAGHWTDCVEDSRPVMELLQTPSEVKALLLADGLSEPAADELLKVIDGEFYFASKFIHELTTNKKDLSPPLTAKKEDAYFVYATAVSIVNLLGRKSSRQSPQK